MRINKFWLHANVHIVNFVPMKLKKLDYDVIFMFWKQIKMQF